MKDASAAGATVLIYLDAIIDNPYGRYHDLLNNASECGPATSRWPGNYQGELVGLPQRLPGGVGAAEQAQVRPGEDGRGESAHGRLLC